MATQDPKDVVRQGYDVISRTYRADDADAGNYAGWIARLREYLPDTGWTGAEVDWKGAPMSWSHADATTCREWLAEVGLHIEAEDFFREGSGGHPGRLGGPTQAGTRSSAPGGSSDGATRARRARRIAPR